MIIVCSCGRKPEDISLSSELIKITKDVKDILITSDYVVSIDSIDLKLPSDLFVADVEDACLTDSFVVVLDAAKQLFVFNKFSGKLIHKIVTIGHSNTEYINPVAICADSTHFYVYDLQTMKIMCYNKDIQMEHTFFVEYPTIDFAKVNDGFVLYNLNAGKNESLFVHIDEHETKETVGGTMSMEWDLVMSKHIFDVCGTTYGTSPTTGEIFVWNENLKKMQTKYQVQWEDKRKEFDRVSEKLEANERVHIHTFLTSRFVITSYLHGDMVYTNMYDRHLHKSTTGIAGFHPTFPFTPLGNETEDRLFSVINDDQGGLILISYEFKK